MQNARTQKFKSTCSYCGVGCGVIVEKNAKGQIKVTGDESHPSNKGMLCSKGMNLHYTVADQSDRLLYPEMRWARNQPRRRVDWDTALERASAVFGTFIDKHGPDSVGFYVSGQCLTEEYYTVNKLAKGFVGTNNIDTNSRLCMSSAVAGYKKTLGEDSVPISYEDIELANCFFIAGANPAWCHPIIFRRIEAHKEKHPDVKVIVADPRKTQSCSIADLHLQLNPGTDTTLFQAIARCLIEDGRIDESFVEDHTDGFDELKMQVMAQPLREAAKICGLKVQEIKQAARWIGDANGYISMWAMGLNQSVDGTEKNLALINLSLITGQIGKPGAGPFSLTGQPNAMGGREVGGMASLLSAHRDLSNPAHRREVADRWGVSSVPAEPGYTATEMFDALRSGAMKAIWIICTNPVVSMPHSAIVEEALEEARFVVVQDISQNSETTDYADLLLPAAGYLEKEGTMTNSERRISYLNKVVDPPGEALPDAEILCRFARKMGYSGFDFEDAAAIFSEHCKLTEGTNIDISGLSYEYLKQNGTVQWPFLNESEEGTRRLFTDHQFYTPNGRAQIHTRGEKRPERPGEDHPFVLTTGRIRDQWHTMTRTGKVSRLNQHIEQPYVEIHPKDAKEYGIRDGEVVQVSNDRGEVRLNASFSDGIKRGMLFIPMHWGKVLQKDYPRANNLTSDRIDPVSKEPDFKYSSVAITKFKKEEEKILVVGAGAAAFQFINSYRQHNMEDEIQVFSKEYEWFYNRVLLPDYISGELDWKKLKKMQSGKLVELDILMHEGISVDQVQPDEQYVTDSNGEQHRYDKLVLATGSRANFPRGIPQLPGVFTIRNRTDADELMEYTNREGHVIIVGGGLLGLEMAASLRQVDVEVTLVHRNPRLMERQLDQMASELLYEHIHDCGIRVIFNDEIEHLSEQEEDIRAGLKSGKFLTAKAVVYAIGTRPNIGLAKEAGLDCKRGVIVNDHLQASDPNIYAIGEIAEHNGSMNGITAAAEQQADIVASYIAGDLSSHYTGSISMNILKFPDLELCSLGITEVPDDDASYEEIVLVDKGQRFYKKCIVHNDRLVGAILMGDKTEFNDYRRLIEQQMELSDKRKELLRSGQSLPPMKGELVCSCNNVGDGNIREVIREGCSNFKELCQLTGAGTGCGSCKPEVKAIMEEMAVAAGNG
ncbi:nitrate reductase [Fodinibius salsisoli]|uniref:Molybdopterin-dependent oxidoreductase n=1 Tax=Fodinibius salsisoli TaxID=2820877 RepID=A0ABT3PTH6_9BACT|nr:nitrate reductase [Fodinibius salsisoli]MCW9709158.1 molybdopterin-dependent oxidoreductase [Fodinibius salsisoli]